MCRSLRDRNPDYFHLVSARTDEARIWMLPRKDLNNTIGGVLARYQRIFRVNIYSFAAMGNHLHLLLDAPKQNLDEFMENVLREIARRVNRYHGRKGHFWGRRYDDQVILTEEDLLEGFLYVTTNPVRHGLLRELKHWAGLNCYEQLLDEKARKYTFILYSAGPKGGGGKKEEETLELSPLPQHEKLSKGERVKLVRGLIQERQSELVKARLAEGQGFMKLKKLRRQTAGAVPREVANSPRPPCYTKDAQIRHEYREQRELFREIYDDASRKFRGGDLLTTFPEHCFKPPLHRKPRRWVRC